MEAILLNIVIGLVLSFAGQLISSAFAPKQEKQKAAGTAMQTGGDVPLSFLVGSGGTGGKLDYANSYGTSGDTPNANLVQVISLGDLPGVACTGIYENGQALTKSASGHVARGYPVTERKNGSSDRLWWEFYDGTQTTADSFLTTNFGSDPNYPWDNSMIGRGVPYMRMTALVDRKVWNGYPQYVFAYQGIPLYDPTKDSTVGGSGSQRLATPSTWAFSDNPAVIIYNILLGIYYGSNWVWGGRFLRNADGSINASAVAYRLPYATWAAAINACNATVSLAGGGSEARFRVGREISVSETPLDVINELLTCCNARMAEVAGIYSMIVGDPGAAVATFTDSDIVIDDSQTLEPFPAIDDVINGATAQYSEPTQAYGDKQIAYYSSTLETADDGRRNLVDLNLRAVPSGTQAQRVVKAQVLDARRFARHAHTLTPKWGTYRPGDVLAWTSTRNGYSSKAFLVTATTIAANGNAIFGLQEIDSTDHDWTAGTDEQALTFAPLTPILPAAVPMTGWTASATTYTDSGSTARRLAINVQFAGGLSNVRGLRIQIREAWGSKNTIWDSGEQAYDPADADPVTRRISWAGILPATTYEVRGQFIPFSGQDGTWSSWVSVTTADIRTALADLSAELQAFKSWASVQIRNLTEQVQLATALGADQDASNWDDRRYSLQQIALGDATVSAGYTQAILVALGASGTALADAITAVNAASGDISAGLLTRMTAMASPGGGWARYGIQARVDTSSGFPSMAGFYLEAKSDGSSRIGLLASQTVFYTADGTAIAAISDTGIFGSTNGVVQLNMITGAFSITV